MVAVSGQLFSANLQSVRCPRLGLSEVIDDITEAQCYVKYKLGSVYCALKQSIPGT